VPGVTFATLLFVPIALDGEAAGANNSAIGVISVLSIIAGYVLLVALWYFVFRRKAPDKRDDGPSE
jgi:uncharacterized membrane protein (GlpM family)